MPPQTLRRLDGLLAIGPHRLDAQLRALVAYAARNGYLLDVVWAILPGEDAANDAPDTGFPIVAFDDEIAGFAPWERESPPPPAGSPEALAAVDWHLAYAVPQRKCGTTHLPVYGCASDRESSGDALLCVGTASLDRQLGRIEAFAMRSAIRLRGVYIASDPDNLRVLLRDFSASNRALGTGPTLTVGPRGEVEVHV